MTTMSSISVAEVQRKLNLIASEHRCPRKSDMTLQCDHEVCKAILAYEEKIKLLLENAMKCPTCSGTGKVPLSP